MDVNVPALSTHIMAQRGAPDFLAQSQAYVRQARNVELRFIAWKRHVSQVLCWHVLSDSNKTNVGVKCYLLHIINFPRSVFPRGAWGLGATVYLRCVCSWRR